MSQKLQEKFIALRTRLRQKFKTEFIGFSRVKKKNFSKYKLDIGKDVKFFYDLPELEAYINKLINYKEPNV